MLHHANLKFKETLKFRSVTNYIVVHHTEVTDSTPVEEVHQWHLNKGWAGIGYHFYIRKNGEIYEGRPIDAVGAHVKGHNHDSIGVCIEGNFNKQAPDDGQLDAAVMLLSLLSLAYGNAKLVPHRAFTKVKNCPGRKFPFDALVHKVEECKKYVKSFAGTDAVVERWLKEY